MLEIKFLETEVFFFILIRTADLFQTKLFLLWYKEMNI